MPIPLGLHVVVPVPAVGVHLAAGFDGLADKGIETLGGGLGNAAHANAPNVMAGLFGRYDNQRFGGG
jgi:hypothetical protein